MTEAQYFQKVAKIEQLNRHHELLAKLKSRFSLVHAEYVDIILKQLLAAYSPQIKAATPSVSKPQTVKNQSVGEYRDDIFRGLLGKKYNIRTRLNVAINKFHNCGSDYERKNVSIEVNAIENELRDLQTDIDYYERNGRMPPSVASEKEKDFFEMPPTIEGIEKRMNTAKVSVHNCRKDLEQYDFKIINDSSHPQHQKWQKAEKLFQKWDELQKMLRKEREKFKKA